MAHPHVTDGRDGFQIWQVAAKILNKQSWTADKELSCNFGVKLTPPHHIVMKCHKGP
jgi:hypothetical protein